jgi:hypothetical protein
MQSVTFEIRGGGVYRPVLKNSDKNFWSPVPRNIQHYENELLNIFVPLVKYSSASL